MSFGHIFPPFHKGQDALLRRHEILIRLHEGRDDRQKRPSATRRTTEHLQVNGLHTHRLRSKFKCNALLLEEDPAFHDVRQNAGSAVQSILDLVPRIESLEKDLQNLQEEAGHANEAAKHAEHQAQESVKGVETALRDVRQLTAELQDQQEEVSTEDLLGLAAVLLQSYLELNNISEYLDIGTEVLGLAALHDVNVIVHIIHVNLNGKLHAIASVVVGEKFPDGKMEGTKLHWGCGDGRGRNWQAPPAGWQTLPPKSYAAGRAWQTIFDAFVPVRKDQPINSDPAYGAILQLPLDGVLLKSGTLNFVLKRHQKPEWLQGHRNRDFSVPLTLENSTGKSPGDLSVVDSGGEWRLREENAVLPQSRNFDKPDSSSFAQQRESVQAILSTTVNAQEKQEGFQAAQHQLQEISELIAQLDSQQNEARAKQEWAQDLNRKLEGMRAEDEGLQRDCQSLVIEARRASAMLWGSEEEVNIADLTEISEARLSDWLGWVSSRNSAQGENWKDEDQPTYTAGFRIHGLDGHVVCSSHPSQENGLDYTIFSITAAESFPEGILDGVVAHWGLSSEGKRGWSLPPKGWISEPDHSRPQGGATETSLERVNIAGPDGSQHRHAYTLLLQIPLDEVKGAQGVKLVFRTQSHMWLGCSNHGVKQDFFFPFQEVEKEEEKIEESLTDPLRQLNGLANIKPESAQTLAK